MSADDLAAPPPEEPQEAEEPTKPERAASPLAEADLLHVLRVALWRGGIAAAFLVVAMTLLPLVVSGWFSWRHVAYVLQGYLPFGFLVIGITAPLEALTARRAWGAFLSGAVIFLGVALGLAACLAQLVYAEAVWTEGTVGALQAVLSAAQRDLPVRRVVALLLFPVGVTLPVLVRTGRIEGKIGPMFGCLSALGVVAAFAVLHAGMVTPLVALLVLPVVILPLGLGLLPVFAFCDRAQGGKAALVRSGGDPSTLPPLQVVDRVLLRCTSLISPATALAALVGVSVYEFSSARGWSIGLGVVTWLGINLVASNLGAIHTRAKRYARGLAVLEHQLAVPRVELGARHVTFEQNAHAVRCLLGLGRLADARVRLAKAFGDDDQATIARERRVKLITAFLEAGDPATAAELARGLPPEGTFALNHRIQVARAFLNAGVTAEAVALLEDPPGDAWGLQRKSREDLLKEAAP